MIISGGAPGADTLAEVAAAELNLETTIFPADWERYGRSAGPKRNLQMLDTEPDLVIAFAGGRGTAHTVRHALKRGIPVRKES